MLSSDGTDGPGNVGPGKAGDALFLLANSFNKDSKIEFDLSARTVWYSIWSRVLETFAKDLLFLFKNAIVEKQSKKNMEEKS